MSSSFKIVISNEQQYRIGDLVAHGAFSEVYKCHKLINTHSHHHHHHNHHNYNKHEEQHEEEEEEENHCHKRELEEEKLQEEHQRNTHDDNDSNINAKDDDNNEETSSAILAIKIVNKDLAVQHHMEEALIREVNAMEAVGYSPYVVHLIDRFISSSNYYIVMNYMEGGTLLEFIRAHRHHIDWTQATATNDGNRQALLESECKGTINRKQKSEKETTNTINETPSSLSPESTELPFMWRVAPYFLKQLLLGLQHLHTHNVVHRDIKPENLLLSHDASKLMISDFGFACYAPPNRTLHRTCGTLKYCAPELLVKKPRYDGRKVDIWAAGVTLYVMLCFTHPFKPTRNDADALLECILESTTSSSLMLPETLPHAARDVLQMMLATDPQQRASIEELLAHPWLEQVELKGRHDNPSSATWHTAAVKRKNDDNDDDDASVEPSITKKRRISESKCNAQTQVTSLANEMKINDDKLTHSSLSVPLAAQTKNSIIELDNKKDIINSGGEESHVNGNYSVNQCGISTTILDSNNHVHYKDNNNFTSADNTITNTNIICCNSSDSENDTSCYSQECISPDSMVSTDNGFYCSLHLSRVNTSDDVSGSNLAKLQSDYAEYNVNGLTQSSLEKEDSPQLTFLTPVSSNNEDTSRFPEHLTLRCNSCNVSNFADITPFLLHTAINEDMSECHGYDASKHIGTNAHAPCRREDNWRSAKQKRQTAALPPLRSTTMIHGIFYLVLLVLYIQLFFLISCLSFIIESCFNARLSEVQHPYWLRELLCYCTIPPLDRLNMWMSSSSLPLHAPNSHEWKARQQRIHKNKKENSVSNRNNVDARKDNAMHSAYGNFDTRIDKDELNTHKTSISEKLQEKEWKFFRYMKATNSDQCLESDSCNHIIHENEYICTSRDSKAEMSLCHHSIPNANIMRIKLQNEFCKRETVERSERRNEELRPCYNKLDCNDSTCILNQNAKLQNTKVKSSTSEHQIQVNKTDAVAKATRKAVKAHDTTEVIKNTKAKNNDSLISEKSCQLETKKVSTYSNNNAKINTINTNGAYSPTFPFPPARLSFNSSTVNQEDFPLSNVSTSEAI